MIFEALFTPWTPKLYSLNIQEYRLRTTGCFYREYRFTRTIEKKRKKHPFYILHILSTTRIYWGSLDNFTRGPTRSIAMRSNDTLVLGRGTKRFLKMRQTG